MQRPSFDARPHTVHAHSPAPLTWIPEHMEQSDGDMTPRPSAAGLTPPANMMMPPQQRRMSRDDTTLNVHMMAENASTVSHFVQGSNPAISSVSTWGPSSSRTRTRQHMPRFSASSSASSDSPVLDANDRPAPQRRFSTRSYKDKLRENISRMPFPARVRRSSSSCYGLGGDDHAQPTSPPKRSVRQGEGPRKQRSQWDGNRKDTPAPAATAKHPAASSSMPVRPATANTRDVPTIVCAGGEGARKAAALHNTYVSPIQFNTPNWSFPPEDTAAIHDNDIHIADIHTRRQRLGSIESATDSAADLTAYNFSDACSRDEDGDINMANAAPSAASPPSSDFTRIFPDEIAISVFKHLDAADLARCQAVNRQWNALAQDPYVWREAFLRKYDRQIMSDPPPIQVGGVGVGIPNKPDQQWRRMYKARVALEKNWRAGADKAGKAVYLSGHTDSVYCLQFDEEKIITGSRDRTIRVWDAENYQCLRVIGGPNVRPILGPKNLRTVDYPSFHMATASVNGTAYGDGIYHVPKEWHDASILCLQYDDEILVTGSSDSDLLIWDIKTYEPIKRLKKHTGGVLDVALDAKHIVSCSKDSRIIVWERETLEPKGDLTGHRGPVNAVQLRGHLLVSASGDGIARLWDLNQMKLIKEFSAKERGLAAVEFSEDMKYVLAGGNDNITYKFDRETGEEIKQFTGHTQLVRSLWLDSANSRVVSGSYDLDLRVYDFNSGAEIWRGEEWTTSWMLAAKSDYRRIVATSQDGRILIVDFGIHKSGPCFGSIDGTEIDGIKLLRGKETSTAIEFRNPWEPRSQS